MFRFREFPFSKTCYLKKICILLAINTKLSSVCLDSMVCLKFKDNVQVQLWASAYLSCGIIISKNEDIELADL